MKYYIYVDKNKGNVYGMHPVQLVFKDGTKMFKVNTGLTSKYGISGREFDKSETNAKVKTTVLNRILVSVEEYLLINANLPFDEKKADLRVLVTGKEKAKKVKYFADYVMDFAQTKDKEGTKGLFIITANKITEYDERATFDTITKDWLMAFERYYTKQKGMSINGIGLHLRNIRTVFNWAIDNEWTDKYPFRRFKVKQEKVAIRNLTAQQIAQLRDYEVEPWQEIYRDMFMLSFYLCGMNAVDLLNVKKLTNGRMVYHRQKTGHLFNLPVPDEAMAIIEKYKGVNQLLSPLDNYSGYKDFLHHWNDALKKIGEIDKVPDKSGRRRKIVYKPLFPDITTYCARYSFASIAAELDIPRETIALCLGHSWADVTSHYVAYDTKKIDKAVKMVIDYVNRL